MKVRVANVQLENISNNNFTKQDVVKLYELTSNILLL